MEEQHIFITASRFCPKNARDEKERKTFSH